MNGWMGTILRVDLCSGKVTKETLEDEFASTYIGGRGFNSKVLYDEVKPGTDPLGPYNKLILGVGPCNGTLVPASSRFTITAKSPLSGFIGDSNSGGSLGARLKYAGYDMVIVEGKAKEPVYLWIDDDKVELRDAEQVWGKTVEATRRALEREIGDPDISTVIIGPAGENLVKFACIVADLGRAAGRAGMGAVMGSKRLKAIVVRGTKGVKVAERKELEEVTRLVYQGWRENEEVSKAIGSLGTLAYTQLVNDFFGSLPTRNFREGTFNYVESILPELVAQDYFLKMTGCFLCPVPCDPIYVIDKGRFAGTWGAGLQASVYWWFSSFLGVSDLEFTVRASALSNDNGLDAIDTGGVIAFAIECFEKGLLTEKDTGGLRLEWGNGDSILKLMDMIIHRRGIGDLFADGVRKASEEIGKGCAEYAMHVKGLGLDGIDPRGHKGWALGYAIAARGADHCRTNVKAELSFPPGALGFDTVLGEVRGEPEKQVDPLTEKGKGHMVKWYEDVRAFENCMEICQFILRVYPRGTRIPQIYARLYNAVTGSDLTEKDLLHIGERIVNLERAFNVREGLTRKDDSLPDRFLKEPMPSGPSKGQVVDLEVMLDEYYRLRGWYKDSGVPTREKLEALNLTKVADELETTK